MSTASAGSLPPALGALTSPAALRLAGSLPLGYGSRLTIEGAAIRQLPSIGEALAALVKAVRFAAPAPQSPRETPLAHGRTSTLAGPTTTHQQTQPSGGQLPTRVGLAKQRVSSPAEPPPTRGNRHSDEHGAPPADPIWDAVRRAQEGDPEAFAEIYDRYLDTVYRYVFFRVSNRQLAEDLTSEAFLRALRRIGSVTWQGRDLGAWLVTIARNLIADHYKSGRYRLEIATADMLDEDRPDGSYGGQPESEVLDHLTNTTLLQAVKKLNPEQQECIVLRFLQGMSVAETAAIMGKNDGAIKALQYRAVRSLGRLLPEGFTP